MASKAEPTTENKSVETTKTEHNLTKLLPIKDEETLQYQWDDTLKGMKKFPYFIGLDDMSVRECCFLSTKTKYEKDEIVFGDGHGNPTMAHFILDGEVAIIQHLLIEKYCYKGSIKYRKYSPMKNFLVELENKNDSTGSSTEEEILPVDLQLKLSMDFTRETNNGGKPSISMILTSNIMRRKQKRSIYNFTNLPKNVEIRLVQVCLLTNGAVFVDGPFLKNRRIVTTRTTNIMKIPTFWLMSHNRSNIWPRLWNYMENQIPTDNIVYEKMFRDIKWKIYKQKYIKSIQKKHFPNPTTINDVPYSIRIKEPW